MTRDSIVIARAQGILMERYGLDQAKALRMLSWLAEQNNVDITLVARHFTSRSTAPLPYAGSESSAVS